MQYHPKLKKAMEQIKAIIEENDIAGTVVLHTPGWGEFYAKLDPSYSCAKIEGEHLRVRAKLQEDFSGDKAAWEKKVSDTYNMFEHLIELGGRQLLPLMNVQEVLQQSVEVIDRNGGDISSHTTQNN
jgi:hypothetical protein